MPPLQKGKIRAWSGPTVRSLLLKSSYRPLVGDDLWERVQARFTEPLVNNPDRRPPGKGEGKYVLTGLAACGWCHGSLIAVKTTRTTWVYRCGTYHQRGASACPNRLALPKEATEQAVFDSLDQTVLTHQIIDQMVNELWKAEEAPEPQADLRKELATVEQELAHYVQAVASTGPLDSLLAEIKAREERKAHLQAELTKRGSKRAKATPKPDGARIKTTILTWKKATQARIALQTILTTRLVFTPILEDGKPTGAEFAGEGSLSPVIAGIIASTDSNSRS